MSLPPEVLRRLGDDATPERCADDMASQSESDARESVEWGKHPAADIKGHAETFAVTAWDYAIAAAATLTRDGELRERLAEFAKKMWRDREARGWADELSALLKETE